ncbi:FAD-dependent oxidoreductase [Streptomyces sp. NPDC000618]|uniref:FAD-dependent oxidoreductase n=1 Tax=Streptomyces sp. NPDC000618 TaxID=3154265 RepID=UPI0033308851
MAHGNDTPRLSRRGFVSAVGLGTAAALAGSVVGPGSAYAVSADEARQRVVVIGGGIAGLATAWLLDGLHDVTVLESAPSLGGHVASVPVETSDGRRAIVDLGAQFFGSHSHPIYHKLVTSVLQVPTVANRFDNTVTRYGEQTPVMVTPGADRPITDVLPYLPALQAVAELMDRARELEANRDWGVTVTDLVEAMTVEDALKQSLVYPYVASVNGATVSQVKDFSARAALALGVRPLVGDGTEQTTDYVNARDGLQSVISAMAGELTGVTTLVNTQAVGLTRSGQVYQVTDSRGQVHLADQVVFALPPESAVPLVSQLPQAGRLTQIYGRFRYMPGRIVIHEDPVYMPALTADWSSFNITHDDDYAEASISYGRLRGDIDVFKSWALHRREEPKRLLAAQDFRHPMITPDFIRAQGDLRGLNGKDGLWFAGSHVVDVDSQESALYSALTIGNALAPESANRTRLGVLPTTPVTP